MKLSGYSTVALALLAVGVDARRLGSGPRKQSRNVSHAARIQRRCNETDVPTSTLTLPATSAPMPTPAPGDGTSGGGEVSGATPFQNWAGSNLYYAAGLNADQRKYLLRFVG